MKTWTRILIIIMLTGLPLAGDVHAGPFWKKKSKNSCSILPSKFTVSDQIEYRFGVVAGQNIATINSTKGTSQDIITGLMFGAAAQVIWPKGFTLQPEVLYSQKGSMITGNPFRYDIDYIEVPVKAMYRLNMADIKPFGFIAPYSAYAIRLSENGEKIGDDIPSGKIKKLDLGIGAGAGFDVWKIQLSFKYTWGFMSVLDGAHPVRNKVFTLSAGFLF